MLRLRFLMLALLPLLFALSGTAHARNVPGSAAAVQGRVDRQVASNLIDMTVAGAIEAARFSQCEQQREEIDTIRNNACEWGFSAQGQMIYLEGDPSGYDYDSTNGLGTITISRWISPSTILVGGLLIEFGETDTHYNDGDVNRNGAGGSMGLIHHFSPTMAFNLFGGVEWLNYDVSRSNGDIEGDYDATRVFADASLSGQLESETTWLLYRGGLRAINQENDSYDEESSGSKVDHVDGVDLFLLSAVADFKLGTTLENFRPFIQVSGVADLVHDESIGFLGNDIDDQLFSARTGLGVDADVLEGLLSASSGIYFSEDGYAGFDVRLSFSKDF